MGAKENGSLVRESGDGRNGSNVGEQKEETSLPEVSCHSNPTTVQVDLNISASVASEQLDPHAAETPSYHVNGTAPNPNKSIPRLKIVMLVVGTRGDIQPFLAVAKKLQEFGHHVRLATHVIFKDFVKSTGVDFYPLGGDPRVLAAYMARNKGLPLAPGEISIQRKQFKAIVESILPACTEPDLETGAPFRAQAIIAKSSCLWTCTCCRSSCCASAHTVYNPMDVSYSSLLKFIKLDDLSLDSFAAQFLTGPTSEFPSPVTHLPQSRGNRLSYIIINLLIWWNTRGYINDLRQTKLNLPPIAYFSMYYGSLDHLPTGYMWSRHMLPKPKDWGPSVDVLGYCFLNLESKYKPQEEFVDWIKNGTRPIYIGFGSMLLDDPRKTTGIVLEALKSTGQRGILNRGWGDLGVLSEVPDYIFLLEDCPHDWLFPQCSAVIHHGGAGTTASGLKAGCPTTIVPFFGDQFFWGDRIHQKGLGPAPIPVTQLSVEALSNAIRFMLQPEVKLKAMEVAELIADEDGITAAVDAFHRHLPNELPAPAVSLEDDDCLNPVQWLFIQIGNFCCRVCA